MTRWRAIIALAAALALAGPASAKTKITVWWAQPVEQVKSLPPTVREFERRHPRIEVSLLFMGAGGMNPQKLMTSIAGRVPPDVVNQDRFTIGDWASRDAFRPLDDLIARDRIHPGDFYHACWAEAVYRGKVYAIPYGTDDRALYWNKALFRQAGLDPDRPPRTWSELLADAKRLTRRRPDGAYQCVGFIPNWGNSWFYLFSWQMGGEFMSPDGRTCTLLDPRSLEALRWCAHLYDEMGGAKDLAAFQQTFQTNELDPFYVGKVAMKIDGNWVLDFIARYAPNLDFGVAPAPIPDDRFHRRGAFKNWPEDDRFITWSGGFSLAIPRGARHVNEAWEFIRFMTSVEGQLVANAEQRKYARGEGRKFVPGISANMRADEAVFARFAPTERKYREPLFLFMGLMKHSRFRPVTLVGQRLWDEHARAFDLAVFHKRTPQQALREGQAVVQTELDRVFAREQLPLLSLRPVIGLGAGGALLLVAGAWWRRRRGPRLGRLGRREAAWGYLFASPWIIGFLALTVGPILASVVLSFCDYDVLHPARYVGWTNYRDLFGHDWYYVRTALINAVYLAGIGIPLGMLTGLAVAMLLNAKIMGMSWYRTLYYLPAIVPVVATAVLWLWVLNPYDYGLVNSAWRATLTAWLGIHPPAWLADEKWSKPALIFMGLWGAGGGMIIWLAGLQGVPQHLYEAAEIDGATAWHKFWHVTIPMLSPTIFFNLIMGTIGALQTFETVYVVTGGSGGPLDSTLVPVLYLFNSAFRFFKMGFASALAWLMFWIILILTLIQIALAPRWVHYEGK